MPEIVEVSFDLDGASVSVEAEARELLVSVLRERFKKTSVRIGCESGRCGACTVMMDGRPTKTCMLLAPQASSSRIETLQNVNGGPVREALVVAFKAHHALQCGFCTSGMIASATALLEARLDIDEPQVRQALRGNLCRCTGYQHIVDAVLSAAKHLAEVDA